MKLIAHIYIALLVLVFGGCSDSSDKFDLTIDDIKEKHGNSVQLYGESTGPFVSKSSWLLASPATPEHPEGYSYTLIWQENGSAKEKEFSPIPGLQTWANKYENPDGAAVIAVWKKAIEEQKPQGEDQAEQDSGGNR